EVLPSLHFLKCGHRCLSMGVFGCAYVVPKINSLHIIHSHDTLGDASGVAHASVYQPPRVLNTDGSLVLEWNVKKGKQSELLTLLIVKVQRDVQITEHPFISFTFCYVSLLFISVPWFVL
uniref:Uncharacterized protein n=1 Tax=Pygocentrus nattereri TaxID=42514 RepID=A0AAR2LPE5_PYGNA